MLLNQAFDLRRQNKVRFGQPINRMRPGRDLDFSPGKEDVRVVPLFFRKISSLVDEFEGFAKVGKLEGLRDVVFLNNIPSVHLLLQSGEFLTFEWWYTATA